MKKLDVEKVKVLGQGQRWWVAVWVAAFALVWPVASNASEFLGMGAAYAQRLEQYRAISRLWLAPQALISKGDTTSKGDATFLSRVTEAEDSSFSRGRNAASPLAALPHRVSLEPGVSSVSHGLTPSNTYLIA